jgi:hypothetical protein
LKLLKLFTIFLLSSALTEEYLISHTSPLSLSFFVFFLLLLLPLPLLQRHIVQPSEAVGRAYDPAQEGGCGACFWLYRKGGREREKEGGEKGGKWVCVG